MANFGIKNRSYLQHQKIITIFVVLKNQGQVCPIRAFFMPARIEKIRVYPRVYAVMAVQTTLIV